MIKKTFIFPRNYIEQAIRRGDADGSYVLSVQNNVLISIYGSGNDSDLVSPNKETLKRIGFKDCISIKFDDISKKEQELYKDECKYEDLILFNKSHAEKIIDYLDMWHSMEQNLNLLINCHAGISRSGAVGLFATRYLELDEKDFWSINYNILPNHYIVSVLNKVVRDEA